MSILKSIDWKPILLKLYRDGVRPELLRLVQNTESKWDDMAVHAADLLIEKFLGDEVAEKQAVAALSQDLQPTVAQA